MKVLLVATVQSHICQFHGPLVEMLHKNAAEVHVAASNNLAEKNGLVLDFTDKVFDVPFTRSPITKDNIRAYKCLKQIVEENDYDVIHCNTPMGGVITRLVSVFSKKNPRIIYTAHGFHFYKGAPKKNWLVYYPIEKFLSHFTDTLITINKEDYALARKKFHAKNVCYIPGVGVDLKKFSKNVADKTEIRKKLDISENSTVLLSIGELNDGKNHITVLEALKIIKEKIGLENIKYLICGNGKLKEYLEGKILEFGLEGNVKLLGYRRDIPDICAITDLFIFPSFREGLSVALMESMSMELPCVVSRIRGNTDLIENDKGGTLCNAQSAEEFADAISNLLENPEKRKKMGAYNRKVIEKFSVENVVEELRKIYFS